jgi:hypothetical protein
MKTNVAASGNPDHKYDDIFLKATDVVIVIIYPGFS